MSLHAGWKERYFLCAVLFFFYKDIISSDNCSHYILPVHRKIVLKKEKIIDNSVCIEHNKVVNCRKFSQWSKRKCSSQQPPNIWQRRTKIQPAPRTHFWDDIYIYIYIYRERERERSHENIFWPIRKWDIRYIKEGWFDPEWTQAVSIVMLLLTFPD